MKKNQKGITLVSMVITIIVMLILAGVSISAAINDDGVATRGSEAAKKSRIAAVEEDFKLAITNLQMEYETIKATASSITAYRGAFLTVEDLNRVLKESKVIMGASNTTHSFVKTQKQLGGATEPTIAEIKAACWTEEHPFIQIPYGTSPTLTQVNGSDTATENYYIVYLSNGSAADSLGADVYAAIFRNKKGVPELLDVGLVENAITTSATKNGKLKTNAAGTKLETDTGVLPTDVTWLHNYNGMLK